MGDENRKDEFGAENQSSFHINGKPLTFKTGDVAKILNETPAMIRYYCREFEEFLGIEHNPGEHRIFTEREIEYLRYIIYLLKEKNLSVKQAKEFLSTPQGKLMAPIENDEDKVKIFVEVISQQLKEEIGNIIRNEISLALREIEKPLQSLTSTLRTNSELNEKITKSIEDFLQQAQKNNEELKRQLEGIASVSESENKTKENEMLDERLREIASMSAKMEEINQNVSRVDQFISEFRLRMTEQENKKEKRGFLSRLFGKQNRF